MTTRPQEVLADSELTRVVRLVDADTLTAIRTTLTGRDDDDETLTRDRFPRRLRLVIVQAPEASDPTGPEATAASAAWLAEHEGRLRVRSYKIDGFGRVLADVYDPETGDSLSGHLVRLGYPLYGGR